MKLAFILFKYFPYGGLQRDFMRIAKECISRGHEVHVYTLQWNAEMPDDLSVEVIKPRHFTNHGRYEAFSNILCKKLPKKAYDRVVGFNKLPGIDIYYAADPCYQARNRRLRNRLYRLTGRYRHFVAYEQAVFSKSAHTRILLLSDLEKREFQRYYNTLDERFFLLPPTVSEDRRYPEDAHTQRASFRAEFGLSAKEQLLLMVGSGFHTKGLDRTLLAIKALPEHFSVRLIVIGQDKPGYFTKMAQSLGLGDRITIMAGRSDVQRFMLGADILMHPAYSENTGTVLIEAIINGLPVLTTDVCGYASHVKKAEAGIVMESPFSQEKMNKHLIEILQSPLLKTWQDNGIRYGMNDDLFSMPQKATDIIEASMAQ